MLFCNFHRVILFTVPKSTYPNVYICVDLDIPISECGWVYVFCAWMQILRELMLRKVIRRKELFLMVFVGHSLW